MQLHDSHLHGIPLIKLVGLHWTFGQCKGYSKTENMKLKCQNVSQYKGCVVSNRQTEVRLEDGESNQPVLQAPHNVMESV
jgi:hypothetical protein